MSFAQARACRAFGAWKWRSPLEVRDRLRIERLAEQQLRHDEDAFRHLAEHILSLISVHALLQRGEARRGGRLALRRLVEHHLYASAGPDDANLPSMWGAALTV